MRGVFLESFELGYMLTLLSLSQATTLGSASWAAAGLLTKLVGGCWKLVRVAGGCWNPGCWDLLREIAVRNVSKL